MTGHRLWCGFFLILAFCEVSKGFQWASSQSVPDGSTFPACFRQDVVLPWDYILSADEHILNVEWRFVPTASSAEVTLASQVGGHFFADQSIGRPVHFVPKAGLLLTNVQAKDMGTYSVHVHLSQHGVSRTYVQSATLVVTDSSITDGDVLEAQFEGAQWMKASGQHHLVLSCGTVTTLWLPKVDIVWTTPDNLTLNSTFQRHGRYFLAVPNHFKDGRYTCTIDNSSHAYFCISGDSPLLKGGNVTIDAVEGELSLIESKMAATKAQLFKLENGTSELTQQAHSLMANYTGMEKEVENLGGQISKLQHQQQDETSSLWSDRPSSIVIKL